VELRKSAEPLPAISKPKIVFIDNKLINNRPEYLQDIEFYRKFPEEGFFFKYDSLPSYLNFDLFTFEGINTKTDEMINEINQKEFSLKYSKEEIEYYSKKGTKFQIINVVANIHTFKRKEDGIHAYPYSISLIAGQKRGLPETCDIKFLSSFDLAKLPYKKGIYTDFSPFKPNIEGFYTFGNIMHTEKYTDTIGFVIEAFFLPIDIDKDAQIPMAGPTKNLEISEKYNKYRIKRYYTPFKDVNPRRIWGCDSPIELFLIQALAKRNLYPKIQTLIFNTGDIFDNFYHMIESKTFIKGTELITDVDLYFPEKKLAIFCDSKFHRGTKNQVKDQKINTELERLGIRVLRLEGKEIINDLNNCVDKILDAL